MTEQYFYCCDHVTVRVKIYNNKVRRENIFQMVKTVYFPVTAAKLFWNVIPVLLNISGANQK